LGGVAKKWRSWGESAQLLPNGRAKRTNGKAKNQFGLKVKKGVGVEGG